CQDRNIREAVTAVDMLLLLSGRRRSGRPLLSQHTVVDFACCPASVGGFQFRRVGLGRGVECVDAEFFASAVRGWRRRDCQELFSPTRVMAGPEQRPIDDTDPLAARVTGTMPYSHSPGRRWLSRAGLRHLLE